MLVEGHQKGFHGGGAFELRTTCKSLINSKTSQMPSRMNPHMQYPGNWTV